MMSFEKYKKSSAVDFATDIDFISWVKCTDEKSEHFWKSFLEQHPKQVENIDKARKIVQAMHVASHTMNGDSAEKSWNAIREKIQYQDEGKQGGKGNVIQMRYWLAAASVVLLLIAGYFVFINESSSGLAKNTEIVPATNDELLPGGNKAVLTLADGSSIILDSAGNGNVAMQGGATVVKLDDGRLAYLPTSGDDESARQMNTVSTPRGGQYQLALADGTRVWLNAESSITFPATFSGSSRDVSVTGEVYFEVAHNDALSFNVKFNNSEIQVLGTHFNVNAYNEDNRTSKATLFQGSVKIISEDKEILLVPGEQAVIDEQANKVRVTNHINAEEILAWKNGKFYFNNVGIHPIMTQISRWYDVDVEYEGKVDKVFAGTISRNVSASNVFKILEATGGVHFNIEGKKIIVSP